MSQPRTLDASTLEGGGQVLRLSLCLSSLTSIPLYLHSIRGGRPKGGGLKAQHRACARWLANACNARVEGNDLMSQTLLFCPGKTDAASQSWWRKATLPDGTAVRRVEVEVEGSDAASVTLVLQAILPFLLFSPDADAVTGMESRPFHLILRGGTNVTFSPSVDYVEQVLLPNLMTLGLPKMQVLRPLRRGWMNSRRGEVGLLIYPLKWGMSLPALKLPEQRQSIARITATVVASPAETKRGIAERLKRQITKTWPRVNAAVCEEESGNVANCYLLLVAENAAGLKLGADFLLHGRKVGKSEREVKKMMDAVVEKVIVKMEEEIGDGGEERRCLDSHMEDHVVVYMALAEGMSVCPGSSGGGEKGGDGSRKAPSLHTQTARWVAGEILGVEFDSDGSCEGIGLVAGTKKLRQVHGYLDMTAGSSGLDEATGNLELDDG